jgi:hydroxymethylglutaryl-CoA lyase
LDVVVYVSMAFGNPYGEAWSIGEVVDACDLLINTGVRQISLADTVGLATPERIAETLAAVADAHHEVEVGVHLHARQGEAAARIRAAFKAGCRRFDAAIGGLGGCPFAQDALVGNLPTETLIAVLAECGATLPSLGPLEELMCANAQIA